MIRETFTCLCLGVSLLALPAAALTAEQTVEREVVVKQLDGTESVKREKASLVVPGEKIVYSINYYNEDQKPADDIRLVMPVPAEIRFIEGSADQAGVQTTFSIDGGQSFAKRDDLRVRQGGEDVRSANADDITHVRWIMTEAVPSQTRGTLSFKGILR